MSRLLAFRYARYICALGIILLLAACAPALALQPAESSHTASENVVESKLVVVPNPKNFVTATFAGGCFWSMQRMMDEVPGVIATTVGYSGGEEVNPTYEQVSAEITGHAESIQVIFDSAQITYAELLDAFWHDIDPTQVDQQACDHGRSYRSIIFYHDAEQQRLAEAGKEALEASGRFDQPIATTIEAAMPFYRAEEYHQKYYVKNPEHYNAYRVGCGRDERLAQIWGTSGH